MKTASFIPANEFVLTPFDQYISAHAWDDLCMRLCWPSDIGVKYQSNSGSVVVFSGSTPDLFNHCYGREPRTGEAIMKWRQWGVATFAYTPAEQPPASLLRGAAWYFCNCDCENPSLELTRAHYCILKNNKPGDYAHTRMRVFKSTRDIFPGESLTWDYGYVSNPFVPQPVPIVNLADYQAPLLPEIPFAFPIQNWVSQPSYMPAPAPDAEVLSANTQLHSDVDSTADVVHAMLSLG